MEICAKPGMVSDGASVVSNEMKAQAAAVGFRVKSGCTAEVLVIGPTHSPKVFTERDACGKAAGELNRSDESVRRVIPNTGRNTLAP